MIQTWVIADHISGDTFNDRKITFPFDISECKIKMQFRVSEYSSIVFEWSSEDETFEKINNTQLLMKSKILEGYGSYISDLEVTFLDGVVRTHFKAFLKINKDVTR